MGAALQFARRHLVQVAGIAIAICVWIYGVVTGALQISTWVLPPGGWQLIAGAVFIASVVAILYHWDKEHLARGSVATNPDPARTAVVPSREVLIIEIEVGRADGRTTS